MKIGIITICKVNNYGAELQAFATQKKLEQMGYDVEIIDYTYYKNWYYKDTFQSRPFIKMNVRGNLLYWLKYRAINCFVSLLLPIFNNRLRKRNLNFKKFFSLEKFSEQYNSIKDLYIKCKHYDVYIVGSDQVWNPAASSSIEPYFLTFAPKNCKKISYASSFGISNIPPSLTDKYKKLLLNINSISVREQSGVDIVEHLTNKKAKLVLDPTLLLDIEQWKPYMNPVNEIPQKYILVYELLSSPKLREVAVEISKKEKLPIYCICKRAYAIKEVEGMKNLSEIGPSEFLWLIANASCVITNSFHGTAFSVNFKVPFYSILRKDRKNNARMISLLSKVNLTDRILYEDNISEYQIENALKPIDNIKLKCLRKESEDFLRTSINS